MDFTNKSKSPSYLKFEGMDSEDYIFDGHLVEHLLCTSDDISHHIGNTVLGLPPQCIQTQHGLVALGELLHLMATQQMILFFMLQIDNSLV